MKSISVKKHLPETDSADQPYESEVMDYLYVREQRRRLVPRAALVGLLAGFVANMFRASLEFMDSARLTVIAWSHGVSNGWIAPLALSSVGALLAVVCVRVFAPETKGSGIPHLQAVLRRHRELVWQRILPVKFIGGLLAIGTGLALGREGPTVQMGGAVGAAVAEKTGATAHERLILIMAGAGAGLAAAFNAPLSGFIFVLEELQRNFRKGMFAAALIASAIAGVVARAMAGQQPVFVIPSHPASPLKWLPLFALLGLICGGLAVVFNRGLIFTINQFARLSGVRRLLAVAGVGALIGIIGWQIPQSGGMGHHLTERILEGHMALMIIPLWFLLRFFMTMISYGTGAAGGIFAPLLTLGSLIGLGLGLLMARWQPAGVTDPSVFAVVGMAAYFAAIVRAPLTGILLIIEMTGSYGQLLPLMTACFCSYLVSDALGDMPIYERLLDRDLAEKGPRTISQEPIVIEMDVEPGSPFDGKLVRDLGLPPGCRLIACRELDQTFMPTAETRLTASMNVTAMIAPGADAGLMDLREGCETPRG